MLFRKRNKKADEHPLKDQAARGIARVLLRMQTKFSEFVNANTKNIPVKGLKIFLIVFCLFGGGFSIYLIAEAIFKEDKRQRLIKMDKVNIPKYYDQGGTDEQTQQYVNEETFRGIQSFEKFMDSLKKSESGRKLHDSILIIRPRLMDSIRMLKEIYKSQIK
jgi:hypothetical protein